MYSLHAPEVECIGKGKAHRPYEFGVKVSVATPVKHSAGGQFVTHVAALRGNPYDGHTLATVIPGIEALVGNTENEVNGLAFPDVAEGIVVFGLGYSLDLLSFAVWMRDREIYYWGDIDTHGFVMLDRLRATFFSARSLLMDRETLLAHRALWGREDMPFCGVLSRLEPAERELFEALVHNRFGNGVRLEQERITFGRVQQALQNIAVATPHV